MLPRRAHAVRKRQLRAAKIMEALRRVAVQSGRSRPKISPFAEGGPRVQAHIHHRSLEARPIKNVAVHGHTPRNFNKAACPTWWHEL